jgi:hypothetical protein
MVCVVNRNGQQGHRTRYSYRETHTVAHSDVLTLYSRIGCLAKLRGASFLGADSWWAFLARIAEIPGSKSNLRIPLRLSYTISHQAFGGVQCLVSSVSIISC